VLKDDGDGRKVRSRHRVAQLLLAGLTQQEIAERIGLSKSTVAYHARQVGRVADERFSRRYDWALIQAYYDEGHSLADCEARFGFSRASWSQAVKRGAIVSRPRRMPIEQLLAGVRQRSHLKLRLVAAGLKEDRCELCGIDTWNGSPLSLALHHVNGDGTDNRLENLQLLCPNCHSQTTTFAGRNRALRRRRAAGGGDADGPTAARPSRTAP